MTKKLLSLGIIFSIAIITILSCGKDEAAPTKKIDPSFTEEFDTLANVLGRGWVIKNNTKPLGTVSWNQGFFFISLYHGKKGNNFYQAGMNGSSPSYSGFDFIMTTSDCGHGKANCSNWLISPEVDVKNGDIVSFYTRTYRNPAAAPDRLEVRVNTVDGSDDVGTDSSSLGGFTSVIADVNPEYLLQGEGSYPGTWTKISATVEGLPGKLARKSRIAFRYYVPNGGPGGDNGLGVGLDKFQFISVEK